VVVVEVAVVEEEVAAEVVVLGMEAVKATDMVVEVAMVANMAIEHLNIIYRNCYHRL
jgi:hypothetical protein